MSDIKTIKLFRRNAFVYFLISLFLLLTGFIYEQFSHGIYSFAMIYAFTVPLICGTLLNMILERVKAYRPGGLTKQLWHCGVATLTVGLLMSGIYQIYGSANPLLNLYYIAGSLLLIAGALLYLIKDRRVGESGK